MIFPILIMCDTDKLFGIGTLLANGSWRRCFRGGVHGALANVEECVELSRSKKTSESLLSGLDDFTNLICMTFKSGIWLMDWQEGPCSPAKISQVKPCLSRLGGLNKFATPYSSVFLCFPRHFRGLD